LRGIYLKTKHRNHSNPCFRGVNLSIAVEFCFRDFRILHCRLLFYQIGCYLFVNGQLMFFVL